MQDNKIALHMGLDQVTPMKFFAGIPAPVTGYHVPKTLTEDNVSILLVTRHNHVDGYILLSTQVWHFSRDTFFMVLIQSF